MYAQASVVIVGESLLVESLQYSIRISLGVQEAG